MSEQTACQYCGAIHAMMCPRIKSIEYEHGQIRRIEFHQWVMPESAYHQPLRDRRFTATTDFMA